MDTQALGRYLRETREARELTLDDAMQTLRIRRGILEAFEQGDFSTAGSPVQVRGLLRNYGRYLGLDEERILQYYDAALTGGTPNRRWGRRAKTEEAVPVAPKRITDTPPSLPTVPITLADKRARRSRGWIGSSITGAIGLAAVGVIIFVVWNMVSKLPPGDDSAATATPAEVGVLAPSATYTASWTPLAPPTLTQLVLPEQIGGGVTVMVEFTQRSYLVLRVDGEQKFEGIVAPGYFQQLDAANSVEIKAANAAGLKLTVNGMAQQSFGERGEEVQLFIDARGVRVVEQSATEIPTLSGTVETPVSILPSETPGTPLPRLTPFPVPGVATATPAQSAAVPATSAADVQVADTASVPTVTPSLTKSPEPSPTPFVPTLTPLPVIVPADTSIPTVQPTEAQIVPTLTPFVSPVPTATASPVPPTIASVPTATTTAAVSLSPTAVLPLRVTQSGLPPTKAGR